MEFRPPTALLQGKCCLRCPFLIDPRHGKDDGWLLRLYILDDGVEVLDVMGGDALLYAAEVPSDPFRDVAQGRNGMVTAPMHMMPISAIIHSSLFWLKRETQSLFLTPRM